MAQFFIDRPVFAWVLAIAVMLAGTLAVTTLPVAQYPEIAPPAVTISAEYPGASAEVVENSVIQIIEQAMTGLDNFQHIYSQSSSAGWGEVVLTFEAGTDPDIAQIQVQNKLQGVMSLLPQVVQNQGVQVRKSGMASLLTVAIRSLDGSHKNYDLVDFFASHLRDPISRIAGVGRLDLYGAQYAMRVWLDPYKLHSYSLTPAEVAQAIRNQNSQVAVGSLGGTPIVPGQQSTFSLTAQTLCNSPEEFARILLKVNSDSSRVRLEDVARVEIGAEYYSTSATLNGQPAAGASVRLAPGANALETARKIKQKIRELSPSFPPGIEVVYPYDTTKFVEVSIREIVHTLVEAVILVVLVVYLFLQNFRTTLIPAIAIPVVLLGTFGIMSVLGFSINTLTMFGLVLAIGLLVDDAIVVVENVERIMAEEGLPPREATRKSMRQITGALIGVALVLSAVFVPMAFFKGSTGAIYRQFSITLVSAMVLSVLVAVILTPALCATMLKPSAGHNRKSAVWSWFNRAFERTTHRYGLSVGYIANRALRFSLIYLVLIGAIAGLFIQLPVSFIPQEDQGVFMASAQLPVGATVERTQAVLDRVSAHLLEDEAENVEHVFAITGFSFAGEGQNMGMIFVMLKDWSKRKGTEQSVDAIIARTRQFFSGMKEAQLSAFNLPGMPSLGRASGFNLFLQDVNGLGHTRLMEARDQLLDMAGKNPDLAWVRANGMEDTPEYALQVDYEKAMALGLRVEDINTTLRLAWGSAYVNDFILRGRLRKVYLQADAPFRMTPKDINIWHIRNDSGNMVPFSSIVSASWSHGAPKLERFNGSPALEIMGEPALGRSSGEAMQAIAATISELPGGFGHEWTGASYQELQSGAQAPFLYAFSLIVVFLCLAALYESWTVPFSVMLAVPLGVLGALVAAWMRGLENDIYFQVGLLTTIGLSAKNAILIVEFAKRRVDKGHNLLESTIRAAHQRLRPILMTSQAFMLGVLPLVVSTGAGANSRHAIGTGVFGGVLFATLLAIFFIPLFFVMIVRFFSRKSVSEDI